MGTPQQRNKNPYQIIKPVERYGDLDDSKNRIMTPSSRGRSSKFSPTPNPRSISAGTDGSSDIDDEIPTTLILTKFCNVQKANPYHDVLAGYR
eukprot:scaffold69635_cov58-Attheya_sp.AAC.4